MRIDAAVLRQLGSVPDVESLELSGPRPDEVLIEMKAAGVRRARRYRLLSQS